MLLTKTSHYAIQALLFIALQRTDSPVLVRIAARALDISPTYLAKVMQELCQAGVVNSYRGRLGGFRLAQAPESISLMNIVQIIEGQSLTKDCVLGLKECSQETACPMHEKWVPIKEGIIDELNNQTIATLRDAVISGQYRICEIASCMICGTNHTQ